RFAGNCDDAWVAVEIPVASDAPGTVRLATCGGTARIPADAFLADEVLNFETPGVQNAVVYVRDDQAVESVETLELCIVPDCSAPLKACSFHKHVLSIYDNDSPPTAPISIAQSVIKTRVYLGPLETVAVYSPGHGRLVAQIQNLTDFDYGCTTVGIDRSGRGATPFQNAAFGSFAADKTFYILPQHRHPYGRFRLTLYYTADEIAGWRAATGGEIAQLNMFKSDRPIAGVTPQTPDVNGAYGENQSVAHFGADYAVSAEFVTGFSGFGIGKDGPDGPLPVRISDLTVAVAENEVKLSWRANFEDGVARYAVERSTGTAFESVASVEADGSRQYRWRDLNPPASTLFYRIRIEDFDGRVTYSETREVRLSNQDWAFSFHPNPFNDAGEFTVHPPVGQQTYTVNWRLNDVRGRCVLEGVHKGEGISVLRPEGLSSLSAGVYIFEVPGVASSKIKIVKR
ncbi:MAG: hypothetical protein RMM53_10395, partial [Bacteroidia bacterium]|nr:hypothetical protein [Bacteroidia bacterium]